MEITFEAVVSDFLYGIGQDYRMKVTAGERASTPCFVVSYPLQTFVESNVLNRRAAVESAVADDSQGLGEYDGTCQFGAGAEAVKPDLLQAVSPFYRTQRSTAAKDLAAEMELAVFRCSS